MRPIVLIALSMAAASCGGGQLSVPEPALTLALTTPTYGAFNGEGERVRVTGQVSHPAAQVHVEGQQVPLDREGRFDVSVPVPPLADFVNIDVEARLNAQEKSLRIPVFTGEDPSKTWPDGLKMRLTGEGLASIGDALGTYIDETGWLDSLAGALPDLSGGGFEAKPLGVTSAPTVVVLEGQSEGLNLAIGLRDLSLGYQLGAIGTSTPITIGFERIDLGLVLQPRVDPNGTVGLDVVGSTVNLSDAVVLVDGQSNFIAEFVVDLLGGLINTVGTLILDLVLGLIPDLSLFGPLNLETDLLGTPLAVRLSDVGADPLGVVLGLGIDLDGSPNLGPIPVPSPLTTRSADLVVNIHEGLFQGLLQSEIIDSLTQNLDLGGFIAPLIGGVVGAIPGGGDAPSAETWCVTVDPGDARVARMRPGTTALAALILPDLHLELGAGGSDGSCEPWLDASLGLVASLALTEGTKVGFDLAVVDGAVLYYGSDDDWTEAAVVAGLGGLLNTVVGFAGASFELDLADLLGAGDLLGTLPIPVTLEPEILGSAPVPGPDGRPIPGLFAVSLQLFGEPPP